MACSKTITLKLSKTCLLKKKENDPLWIDGKTCENISSFLKLGWHVTQQDPARNAMHGKGDVFDQDQISMTWIYEFPFCPLWISISG